MRISDWSSDVCSSDLVGEDAARQDVERVEAAEQEQKHAAEAAGHDGERQARHQQHGERAEHGDGEPDAVDFPTHGSPHPLREEHGRAPWRERVGKVGWVPGGGGTLNKKRKNYEYG